ncbi:hypothetical protein ACFL96_19710 [Thermoproteota archaeon]
MASTTVSPIPVVDPSDPLKILGTLSRSDIMRFLVKPND